MLEAGINHCDKAEWASVNTCSRLYDTDASFISDLSFL